MFKCSRKLKKHEKRKFYIECIKYVLLIKTIKIHNKEILVKCPPFSVNCKYFNTNIIVLDYCLYKKIKSK